MSVVVRILLLLFFPIAYPISKVNFCLPRIMTIFKILSLFPSSLFVKYVWQLLDRLLGKGHFALLRRAELKTLVDMHGNEVSFSSSLI